MPLHYLTLQGDHELSWDGPSLGLGELAFLDQLSARQEFGLCLIAGSCGGKGSSHGPSVTMHTTGPLLLSSPSALQCGWHCLYSSGIYEVLVKLRQGASGSRTGWKTGWEVSSCGGGWRNSGPGLVENRGPLGLPCGMTLLEGTALGFWTLIWSFQLPGS